MQIYKGRELAKSLQCKMSELLKEAGYTVEMEVEVSFKNNVKTPIDIVASMDNKIYYIETKYSAQKYIGSLSKYSNVLLSLTNAAKINKTIPVFVTNAIIDNSARKDYEGLYENLIIMDLPNLLFGIQYTSLSTDFISFLPFTIDDVTPEAGKLNISFLKHSQNRKDPVSQLLNCPCGDEGATRFEKVCTEILKYCFDGELTLWKEQNRSNNGLYRFDLLCRIKEEKNKPFWKMIQSFFNSNYIVFEYKNYKEAITQKEIYTTEKYLYDKALRKVAVIIARNGCEKHAQWAAKGSLRESGKLIIILNEEDMINLYNIKQNDEEPSEYLYGKLDDLLAELEK